MAKEDTKRLYDWNLELKSLMVLMCGKEENSGAVADCLAEFPDLYDSKDARRIQALVKARLRRGRPLPDWDTFISDSRFSEEERGRFSRYAEAQGRAMSFSRVEKMLSSLREYAAMRKGVEAMRDGIASVLSRDNTESTSEIFPEIIDRLGKLTVERSTARVEVISSKTSGAENLAAEILNGEDNKVVPTGFKTFDSRSRGIPVGSFMLISATTGGGKSAFANAMAVNMARLGAKVVYISLEMTNTELFKRTLSAMSGVSMSDINKGKAIPSKMRRAVKRAVRELKEELAGELAMIQPSAIGIDGALSLAKTQFPDRGETPLVVIIDYLGLLEGADGDKQWFDLGNMGRKAKVWANENNAIVIGLAQLGDDEQIRYSRALKEHASNLFQWTYDNYSREHNCLRIKQTKARNQEPFDFSLYYDPSHMLIRDLTKEEKAALSDRDKGGGTGGAWKKREKTKEQEEDEDKYLRGV